MDEAGLKGFEVTVWHGLYAPKGTPKAVVDKLTQALQVALKDDNGDAGLRMVHPPYAWKKITGRDASAALPARRPMANPRSWASAWSAVRPSEAGCPDLFLLGACAVDAYVRELQPLF